MNRARTLSFAAIAATAALAQGCASQSAVAPEPQQPTVRETSQTAPADLQLLCASEAAQTYGVASERVLPISSSAQVSSSAQGTMYTVVLNADGTEAVCTIDEEGTVLSLVRA